MRPEFEQAFKNSMSFSSKAPIEDWLSYSGEWEGLQSHEVFDEAQEDSRGARGSEVGGGSAEGR
jgi:hypothetical protein